MQFHTHRTRIDDDDDDEHFLRSTCWRQSYLTDPMESVNFSLREWVIRLRVYGRLEATRFEIVFTRGDTARRLRQRRAPVNNECPWI